MADVEVERGGARWVGRCSPRFTRQVGLLLEGLGEGGAGVGPAHVLWWPVTVSPEGDRRRVLGPPLLCDPPDDLTGLVATLALQLAAARRLGVEAVGAHPDDRIRVAPGALTSEAVMLKRQADPDPGDSGWHVRPDGPRVPYEDDYATLSVGEVVAARRALVWPLALPPGLLVRMIGETIVSVHDGAGAERWAPPA